MVRPGFTLVEVLVSLVLLAVGALSLAAASALALAMLRGAELQERAVREAAAVLDSLAFSAAAGDGVRTQSGVELRWSAHPESLNARVEVRYPQVNGPIMLPFATARVPRLPERRP